MRDNDFDPSSLAVAKGSVVRFRFVNRGAASHEAFFGDEEAQQAREAAIAAGTQRPDEVAPGATREQTVRVSGKGSIVLGCHVGGHYESGMRAMVEVA